VISNNSTRGRFIVFEGLDCSGSSTQSNLLYERLLQAGKRVWLTSEPSGGPIGHLIRLLFSGRVILPPERQVKDRQFAYLFAADRFDHLNNPTSGIYKYLDEGIDVISTRYVLSSLAYNVETQEEEEFVRRLNSEFPVPDALVFLDCTAETSLARMSISRPNRDAYDTLEKLSTAYSNFMRILRHYPAPKLVVDAKLPKDVISDMVYDFVAQVETLEPTAVPSQI
jgi:dTMP kinase